jgi:hypothetical protein
MAYTNTNTNQIIKTLGNVLTFMATSAGGTIPPETDSEYADWVRWITVKQEEYAQRAFWRRLLTRTELSITADEETTLLPDNFHKPNGVYVLEVNEVDWAENDNEDDQTIFVEMCTDYTDDDFGKWRIRYGTTPTEDATAILWYFANPPKPVASTDLVLLPGDMVAYGALTEYYRVANQEGSMDKAEQDAENRFNTYLSMEMIPPKYELLTFSSRGSKRKDRSEIAKSYYTSRTNRGSQY